MFSYLTSFLPVRQVYVTPQVFCFHHPRPIDNPHILVVPKKAIRSILILAKNQELHTFWLHILFACHWIIMNERINRYTISSILLNVTVNIYSLKTKWRLFVFSPICPNSIFFVGFRYKQIHF